MIIKIHEDGTTKQVDDVLFDNQCVYYDTVKNIVYHPPKCKWAIDKFIQDNPPPFVADDGTTHFITLAPSVDRNKWGDVIADIFQNRPAISFVIDEDKLK